VAGSLEGVRLNAAEAAALAAWLGPAILEAGGACAGDLDAAEIVRDIEGIARFAPTNIPLAVSVARAPHTRAPEGGRAPEADLYGLGVVLYRAVTGEWPTAGRPTAPSAFGRGSEADDVLLALLSSDPAARRAALPSAPVAPAPLPEAAGAAGPAPAALPAIRTTVGPAPAPAGVPTSQPPGALPLGRDLPPYVVLVPLAGLDPAALRVVASRSGVDPEAVRRAAARGATWCVDATDTEAEALRVRRSLERAGVETARLASTKAPKVIQLLVLAAVAGVLGFFSGYLLVFGGLAALLVYLAAANLRAMFAVVEARNALVERDRAALPDTAPEARIRGLRRRLASAPLSNVILDDLRAELQSALERLDTLRTLEQELTGDLAADLQARRDRLQGDLAAVNTTLADVEATFARALAEDLDGGPGAAPSTALPEAEPPQPRPRQPTSG
jgi:hypothetical protein